MTGPLFPDPYQKLCRVRRLSNMLELKDFAAEWGVRRGVTRSKKRHTPADAQIICVGQLFPSSAEYGLHRP